MNRLQSRRPEGFITSRSASLAVVPFTLMLASCSAEQVSVGEGEAPLEAVDPLCNGGIREGSVVAMTQADLDALEGCEEIVGDLSVARFADADLRPLWALRVVHGQLSIGNIPSPLPYRSEDEIASLEGLESLEVVNGLSILGMRGPDLKPLSSLRRVQFDPLSPSGGDGHIHIAGCSGLRSLEGLERLETWEHLELRENANLESLQGLGIARETPPNIHILRMPRLRDLQGLEGLRSVRYLHIVSSGIESLRGLELESAVAISLADNPALVDASGLERLRWLGALEVSANPVLRRLPDLPALEDIRALRVIGNPELTELPTYRGGGELYSIADPRIFWSGTSRDAWFEGFDGFEIGDNAKLTSFSAPTNFTMGRFVGIHGNPVLESVDLGGVRDADRLLISNNPRLRTFTASALETVEELTVEDNPLLSTTTFAAVKTFSSTMTNNADTPSSP